MAPKSGNRQLGLAQIHICDQVFYVSVYSHVITRFWPNFGLSDNLPALSHTGFEQQISQYHLPANNRKSWEFLLQKIGSIF